MRLAHVAAEAARAAPRVRRFRGLREQLAKLNAKDARTFEEDGVVYVHRCKKRPRLTSEEKAEVLNYLNYFECIFLFDCIL